MTSQANLDAFLDKQVLTELVYKLARSIDRCDAVLLKSLFHPDATDDHGSFVGTAADFIPWVMDVLATMRRTQHIIGNVLIELDGDTAYGESYFVAHHVIDKAGSDILMIAAGRYLDRFERRAGEWKFAHRHAIYDWSRTEPATDIWDRDNPGATVFGARGHDDASYANRPNPTQLEHAA
ncbi:nuclear transport factor 2 family protein [Sphingosinicellaceae bacterium]|nr:nuclear transport factor 2 family protein [Sphingosinicellaceae bacterium]